MPISHRKMNFFIVLAFSFLGCRESQPKNDATQTSSMRVDTVGKVVNLGIYVGMDPEDNSDLASMSEGELLPDKIIAWKSSEEGGDIGYSGDTHIEREKDGYDAYLLKSNTSGLYTKIEVLNIEYYDVDPKKIFLEGAYFTELEQKDCPYAYVLVPYPIKDESGDQEKEVNFCVGSDNLDPSLTVILGKISLDKSFGREKHSCNSEKSYDQHFFSEIKLSPVLETKKLREEFHPTSAHLTSLYPLDNGRGVNCDLMVHITDEPARNRSGE